MGRVLFHIDLNAFFASAEVLRNCAFDEQPLVVAGSSRRSVVCTASYKAREFGIKSAMPIQQALLLCPHLIVVPADFEWYEECSKKFFAFVRKFTPFVEPASIDECYADVTEVIKNYKRPLDLAWIMQQQLKDELGLTCSIGVAPNRFLAKMASDMRKPMGITVLRIQEVPKKLWPLAISEMQGIGKKTAPVLEKAGIMTIGDLANPQNEKTAMQILGRHGYHKILNARGQDSNKLSFTTTMQSISQSTTLDRDIEDYHEIKLVFKRLANSLAMRAKQENLKGKSISISVRYSDFSTIVRSITLDQYTNNGDFILENAYLLFDKNNISTLPIRHLGITLGSLFSSNRNIEQLNMFMPEIKIDPKKILDDLNQQLKNGKLVYASSIIKKTAVSKDMISSMNDD